MTQAQNIPAIDASDTQWRAFLEQQLSFAVKLLQQRDEAERVRLGMIEQGYKNIIQRLEASNARWQTLAKTKVRQRARKEGNTSGPEDRPSVM